LAIVLANALVCETSCFWSNRECHCPSWWFILDAERHYIQAWCSIFFLW